MGRNTKIEQGPEHERIAIDRCIREHRYMGLDRMVADLAAQGLSVNRSSLQRYMSKLREKDANLATPEEGTIVTIVERASGEVRLVKSAASADAIATLIMTFRPNRPIS
jgi:hypothetical protein